MTARPARRRCPAFRTSRAKAAPASFDIRAVDGDGPFFVQGVIVDPKNGDRIGSFHCWGWAFNLGHDATFVSQEYKLDDLGAIQTQGVEIGADRIAVVGGTGVFKHASGEGKFGKFADGFSIEFDLDD